jgi:hypothetical protein
MADTDAKGWVPPYVSFTTLVGLLDRMKEEGGAPPQIDPSYLDSFSGGYRSQVIAALKSLALIRENGEVTERLTALVEAESRDARETIIGDLLREYYPEPVRLGAIKATQGQLETAFREHGITGDTLRKAIAFYLAAAKFAKVPVSVNFKVPSVTPSDGRKSPRRGARKGAPGAKADGGTPEHNGGDSSTEHRQDADWQDEIDPSILHWLRRIPAKDEPWPSTERARWSGVLEAIFAGIYTDEGK